MVVGGIVGFWLPIVLSVAVEGIRALVGAESGNQTFLALVLLAPWGAVVGLVVALVVRGASPGRMLARGTLVGAVTGAAIPAVAIPALVLAQGENPFDGALLAAVGVAGGVGALLGWIVSLLVRRLLLARP